MNLQINDALITGASSGTRQRFWRLLKLELM